jgi:hypothetical protein
MNNDEPQSTLSDDHPDWEIALAHLEENHPSYLAELLRNGGLERAIRQKMEMYELALVQAGGDDELASEAVFSVNPNWQDQEPLTADEERLLAEFKDSHY